MRLRQDLGLTGLIPASAITNPAFRRGWLSFVGNHSKQFNMTRIYSDTDIERTARGLIDRSLPKPEWTHAAHFAVALWLLREHGLHAMSEMPGLIRAYNEATGVANSDTGGYHETITLASLRAGYAWLGERPQAPLYVTLRELLDSAYGRSDWPLSYWSRDLLFSTAARRGWVDPDLRPLPF